MTTLEIIVYLPILIIHSKGNKLKKSYMNLLVIVALLFIGNNPTFAQNLSSNYKCRAYEYAEMIQMSPADLKDTYCKYSYNISFSEKFKAIVGTVSERENFSENVRSCSQENERLMRALKKISPKSEDPKCPLIFLN